LARVLANLPTQQHNLEAGLLYLHKMPTMFAAAHLLGGGATLAYGLHIAVALGVAVLTILAWYRRAGTAELRAALLAVALVLISPYAYDYDLVVLAVPIALLAADGLKRGWSEGMRTMLVAVWAAPLLLPAIAEHANLQLAPMLLIVFFAMIYRRCTSPEIRGTAYASRT
jgi:hypothetical protein